MCTDFDGYLQDFLHLPNLRTRMLRVLQSLPETVQQDFLQDPAFRITREDYTPGKGSTMFMNFPVSVESVSRCVVLRKKLERAPEAFAQYIIAHEFAHAYLRNGGWDEISDPEDAADALAASWGYPKPKQRWF